MKSRAETPHYYAYVNFESLEDAQQAVQGMHRFSLHGSNLSVKLQGSEAPSVDTPTIPVVQTSTVKVTNIAKIVTEGELTEVFSFKSTVKIASLKLNQTPAEVNFAYVNYTSTEDAGKAVDTLNDVAMRGLKLTVRRHGRSVSDTVTVSSSTTGTSVKVLLTNGSLDESELYDFFSQFGELRDTPKIRPGSPNFAYVNYLNSTDARKASQYPNLQIDGVTVKIRPPSEAVSVTTVAKPIQQRPAVPLCESKKIQCSAVVAQVLTSSDPKYVQHQQSIAPVTINREKTGSGIVLFGANPGLQAAETLVRALISDLQTKYTEKVIDLPCMYIPAFCNQALVNSLSDIEQECLVRFQICVSTGCTQDIVSFSKMVSSRLVSSVAIEVSSLTIALHQKDPTDSAQAASQSASYVWSFKDDTRSYSLYDQASSAKLNESYSSSPQGRLTLRITTKVGPTNYLIDFPTMRQINLETGNARKIKKTLDSSLYPTWLYEDDTQSMVPYTASECIDIEKMYTTKQPSVLTIHSKTYTFDFARMRQINTQSKYERKIERRPPTTLPTQETFFKLQISGLQGHFKEAETKLMEELDNAVVEHTHPLPKAADDAFQMELLQTLHKYFVLSEIVKDKVHVRGIQGYIEKVNLIVRGKMLEFEKDHLARASTTPHSAAVPSTWEPQTDHFAIKDLSRGSHEWKEVENRIHKTLRLLRITSIKRIQNKWLWDRYSFAKERMNERNAGAINEQLLFHGTGRTAPEKIYKSEQGFDFRFSMKGMWGTGTYFAVNASYSNNYCYSSSQGKQMILASVLTGETYRCESDPSLKKPPVKHARKGGNFEDELYDSVSGYTNGSDVFIIYDHEKAYPAYLITY